MKVNTVGRGKAIPLTQAKVDRLKHNKSGPYLQRVWSSNLAGFHITLTKPGNRVYSLHNV